MKFTSMSAKGRNSQALEIDADEILNYFGGKYQFAF